MKLANIRDAHGVHLAIQCENGFVNVQETARLRGIAAPNTVDEAIATGVDSLKQLVCGEVCLEDDHPQFAPVVLAPEKILCVGQNYKKHNEECSFNLPKEPVVFGKFNNALAAHGQVVTLPDCSEQFDYEAELVIVVGKQAKNVSKADAHKYIFGYTVGNDLSARDLQFKSGQWLIGKGLDSFAPVGPVVATADEVDPNKLDICCKLNGEVRQSSNTSEMIFCCEEIVSYISHLMTLKPGDLIFTGTPQGVILGREDKAWIKRGDCVEVSIGGIGTLQNTFK